MKIKIFIKKLWKLGKEQESYIILRKKEWQNLGMELKKGPA